MIIGLGCKRRVGKSTAADYLAKTYTFHPESFATSLKQGIGKEIFGLTDEQMETDLKEVVDPRWSRTPRQILQTAGAALRKDFQDNIWLWTVYNRIIKSYSSNVVISDVRYKNEAEWIRQAKGLLIRVDRKVPGQNSSEHISEVDLDTWTDWDEVLDNNGSFNSLYNQLDIIVNKYNIL